MDLMSVGPGSILVLPDGKEYRVIAVYRHVMRLESTDGNATSVMVSRSPMTAVEEVSEIKKLVELRVSNIDLYRVGVFVDRDP